MARNKSEPLQLEPPAINDELSETQLEPALRDHTVQRAESRRKDIQAQAEAGLVDLEEHDDYCAALAERIDGDEPDSIPVVGEQSLHGYARRLESERSFLSGEYFPTPQFFAGSAKAEGRSTALDRWKNQQGATKGNEPEVTLTTKADFDTYHRRMEFHLRAIHRYVNIEPWDVTTAHMSGTFHFRIPGNRIRQYGRLTLRPALAVHGSGLLGWTSTGSPSARSSCRMAVSFRTFQDACEYRPECITDSGEHTLLDASLPPMNSEHRIARFGYMDGLKTTFHVVPGIDVEARVHFTATAEAEGSISSASFYFEDPCGVEVPWVATEFVEFPTAEMQTPSRDWWGTAVPPHLFERRERP